MPSYNFKNVKTNEISTIFLKISELDPFKLDNPDLQVHITKSAPLVRSSGKREDNGFSEVIAKVKQAYPINNLGKY